MESIEDLTNVYISINTEAKEYYFRDMIVVETDCWLVKRSQCVRIDRDSQTIFIKGSLDEMTFESNYYMPGKVDFFLNRLNEIVQTNQWKAFVAEPEYDENNYCEVELCFAKGEPIRFKATYAPGKMPCGWLEFTERFNFNIHMETITQSSFIFNETFYNAFEEGMLIYCSCMFDESGDTYYYRTEDKTIEEGDQVIVPVGANNKETVVLVDAVEYYKPEDVPFPIEKTKMIIRKVQYD